MRDTINAFARPRSLFMRMFEFLTVLIIHTMNAPHVRGTLHRKKDVFAMRNDVSSIIMI